MLDLSRMTARCPACRRKLDAAELVRRFQLLEAGIEYSESVGRIELRIRWFHIAFLVLAVGFVVFHLWNYAGILEALSGSGLLPVVIIELLVIYYLLVNLANSTRLRLENGELQVSHGPLPCRRDRTLLLSDISGFEWRSWGGQRDKNTSLSRRSAYFYGLYAVTLDGERVSLLPARGSRDQVRLAADALNLGLRSRL
jgi:hypothetical protein